MFETRCVNGLGTSQRPRWLSLLENPWVHASLSSWRGKVVYTAVPQGKLWYSERLSLIWMILNLDCRWRFPIYLSLSPNPITWTVNSFRFCAILITFGRLVFNLFSYLRTSRTLVTFSLHLSIFFCIPLSILNFIATTHSTRPLFISPLRTSSCLHANVSL